MRAGAQVFAATDFSFTSSSSELQTVRWGDAGVVVECPGGEAAASLVVQFQRRGSDQSTLLSLKKEDLMVEPPPLRQGQWVQFTKTIRFRSRNLIQKDQPAVVLDMRNDDDPGLCQVLVRVAPMGNRSAFDVSVGLSEIKPLKELPDGLQVDPGELAGGFRVTDLVFCTADLQSAGASGALTLVVGCGEAGIVFGQGQQADEVMVRFDAHQQTGAHVWLSLPVRRLSREAPLTQGRRVRLTVPLLFPDGVQLEVGHVGVLVESPSSHEPGGTVCMSAGPGKLARCFPGPARGLDVINLQRSVPAEDQQVRLAELEMCARRNDDAGQPLRTVSTLDQNIWALFGHGFGVGLGFLSHPLRWNRSLILVNKLHCLALNKRPTNGLDGTLQEEKNVHFDHNSLAGDRSRVGPYAAAIQRASRGRDVLDIGTGMLCLLARLCLRAGATSTDAIEVSQRSIDIAVEGFEAELAPTSGGQQAGPSQSPVPEWASLEVAEVSRQEADNPCLTVRLAGGTQQLRMYHGLSTDASLPLRGGYSLVVHEILGDMAGVEGAAAVLADVHQRGLAAEGCSFVPRASYTMLAPTSQPRRSNAEVLIHRLNHDGCERIEPLTRYSARHFPPALLLARPQALETLDFASGPELRQRHSLEFRTERDGDFDGMHLHLHADLDGVDKIDVFALHTSTRPEDMCSWNTTYVKLVEEPLSLPAGSRIAFHCSADLSGPLACYKVSVAVGEVNAERHVADFEWQGG